MTVELLKYPTADDWMFCKQCTLVTVGKTTITPPDDEWKRKILNARHSPIRTLQFAFKLTDLPSWVSVHLCRHVHAQPFVKTQRTDRTGVDHSKLPQDSPVDMIWTMNAEELMVVSNKRLCRQASAETREVVEQICKLVVEQCPEFEPFLVPMCVYQGGVCHEFNGGCGWRK